MKAVILAAGQGTRLRPLTDDRPKCLVELAGVSLLQRQCTILREAGIADITIVAGYRAEKISPDGCRILHNSDYASTNMVATLFCAQEVLTGETDVIVSYGDIVYETRVLESVMACSAPVCLPIDIAWRSYWECRLADPLQDAETLKLDSQGCVRELGKKPRSYDEIQGQYIGLFKVRTDCVAKLFQIYAAMDRTARYDGKDFANMYMTSFLQHLIDIGWTVQSVSVKNGWLEVDTIEDLHLYERMHADGSLNRFCKLS